MTDLAAVAAALVVSGAVSPVAWLVLDRCRVRDEPTWRSSHRRPVARGGGVAVAVAVTVGLAGAELDDSLRWALLVTGLGLGAIGLVDDVRRGISPLIRLGAAIAAGAAGLVVLAPTWGPWPVLAGVLALVWVVAYVNAFNFMDGIDGISVAQTVVAGVALAVTGGLAGDPALVVAALVVAAAAAGFAPMNLPVARLFLGDVGSYLLGGLLAVLAVAAVTRGVPPEAAAFPFLVYGADTALTLVRRVLRGERWWDAHRQHTYQRLVDAGWSHGATSAMVAAVSTATSGLGLVAFTASAPARAAAAVAALCLVGGYLALPALVDRRRPERPAVDVTDGGGPVAEPVTPSEVGV